MHSTAMDNGRRFFATYVARMPNVKVLEIGSQDVNGSLRDVCPTHVSYVGADFVQGKGVDIVLEDPYVLPFADASFDVVVSSSCYEHSEFFWLAFMEALRVLKPAGLFYLNVPSNGSFHRYPVDCWRFYPDSGAALVNWAKRQGVNALLLESYISNQDQASEWNDCVSVFLKDAGCLAEHPARILDQFEDVRNGTVHGREGFIKPAVATDDKMRLIAISQIINGTIKIN